MPDIPEAVRILKEDADRELARIDEDGTLARAEAHVIDLDAAESSCPACGDSIPRGSGRCPGCGLRFA